jgi:lipid-A-disaccharide synthase
VKSQKATDIILITNSPGELSTWTRVLAEKIKVAIQNTRIIVALVPCPFASGREYEIAKSYQTVDLVISPWEFSKLILTGILPKDYSPSNNSLVIFLGGDYWHGVLFAKKIRCQAVAYATRPFIRGADFYKYLLCSTEKVKQSLLEKGISSEKLKVVGHLLADGIKITGSKEEIRLKYNIAKENPVIGLFPGSRLYNFKESLPVFLRITDEIADKKPEVTFLLSLSPFLNKKDLVDILKFPDTRTGIPGSRGTLKQAESEYCIITENKTKIRIIDKDQHDILTLSNIAISIPGTNTAECACMGVPVLVVCSWRAKIAPAGIGSLINLLPIGSLRKKIMEQIFNKIKFIALPNILAEKQITPEFKIDKDTREVSQNALNLLNNENQRNIIGTELKEIMRKSQTAEKILEYISELI